MAAFEIRGALASDEDEVLALAHHLNTVNLPDNREAVAQILDQSQKSFNGEIKDPKRREEHSPRNGAAVNLHSLTSGH